MTWMKTLSNSARSLPPVPLVKKIEPITKTQPAIIFYIHYVIYHLLGIVEWVFNGNVGDLRKIMNPLTLKTVTRWRVTES